jgi:hypothetical protein
MALAHDAARRDFLTRLGALGAGSSLFPGVLWAKVSRRRRDHRRVDRRGG